MIPGGVPNNPSLAGTRIDTQVLGFTGVSTPWQSNAMRHSIELQQPSDGADYGWMISTEGKTFLIGTLLMSPVMAAAAALTGKVTDAREMLK